MKTVAPNTTLFCRFGNVFTWKKHNNWYIICECASPGWRSFWCKQKQTRQLLEHAHDLFFQVFKASRSISTNQNIHIYGFIYTTQHTHFSSLFSYPKLELKQPPKLTTTTTLYATTTQNPQINYRQLVCKYLKFLLNLHNPRAKPHGVDVWRSRLAEFAKVPVPRTKEELRAKREEKADQRRRDHIKTETGRRDFKKWTFKSLPAPKPVLFNWRKLAWNSNKGTDMLPMWRFCHNDRSLWQFVTKCFLHLCMLLIAFLVLG